MLDNSFVVYEDDNRVSLHAKSYLRLGVDQAKRRYKTALVAGESDDATVANPYFNSNYSDDFTADDGRVNTLQGSGDGSACKGLATALLHIDYECFLEPCAIAGEHMPEPKAMDFFFGLVGWKESKAVTVEQLEAAGLAQCQKVLEEDELEDEYLPGFCFTSLYSSAILTSYGLVESDYTGDITFARKINGTSASWAIGSMIFENPDYMPIDIEAKCLERLGPERLRVDAPPKRGGTIVITAIVTGVLCALGAGVYAATCKTKKSEEPVQTLEMSSKGKDTV